MQKKIKTFFIVGQLTLVAGVVLPEIADSIPIIDFIAGMCIGLSVVFNLTALIKSGKHKKPMGRA